MIMKVEMTRHAKEERIDRLTRCMVEIGMNEIIREIVTTTGTHGPAIYSITDTGLVFIKSPVTNKLITGYMGSVGQIINIFAQIGEEVPRALLMRVKSNCKRFPYLLEM